MKSLLCAVFLSFASSCFANDLSITYTVLFKEQGEMYALVDVSWKNSWRNPKNHDAAWLFFKFVIDGDRGSQHAYLTTDGHEIINQPGGLQLQIPTDRTGLFISSSKSYRGDIKARLKIRIDQSKLGTLRTRDCHFKAYGIEMVYIPDGKFFAGDPDTSAVKYASLYRSDASGKPAGYFEIKSESQEIAIGPFQDHLFYQSPRKMEGDQKGTVGKEFPKGVKAFYIMKYEPLQGQYAEFLNTLSVNESQERANFSGKRYYEHRGSITYVNGQYNADRPGQPCNFMSWDDGMAFADWTGLRPMTELEFEKACRGPAPPVTKEFPWGNASKNKLSRVINDNGELVLLNDLQEKHLNDDNREMFGASYYWVMDLAGSIWERVITLGDSTGRLFKGTHGDGRLNSHGYATNEDWPSGSNLKGGFGFRGGGFYTVGIDYTDYFPYSPVAFRPYGAWSGGYRKHSYGARFVRTAD